MGGAIKAPQNFTMLKQQNKHKCIIAEKKNYIYVYEIKIRLEYSEKVQI